MPTVPRANIELPDEFAHQCPEHQTIAMQLPDAAKVAGVSVRTLYAINHEGRLPFIKIGRRTLVRRRDLVAYFDSLETVTFGGAA